MNCKRDPHVCFSDLEDYLNRGDLLSGFTKEEQNQIKKNLGIEDITGIKNQLKDKIDRDEVIDLINQMRDNILTNEWWEE